MTSGRWLVLLAALLFSTGGAAIKGNVLSGWQVAGGRSLLAAGLLALVVPASRQGWTWRTWAVGFAYAQCLLLFVSGTKLTTAATAIFLQAAAPLYVAMLAPWLLKERLRLQDWLASGCIAAGLVILFRAVEKGQASAPNPDLGNALAAASGIFWALNLMGLRWAAKGGAMPPLAPVVCGNLLVALMSAPFAFPVSPSAGWGDAGSVLYLGVFQVSLAYVAMTKGLQSVPAMDAALLLMIEPLLNPVWTWWLQGERPGWRTLAGGALILSATLLTVMSKKAKSGPSRPAEFSAAADSTPERSPSAER